jgi:spoIIIJ-associated protein
MERKEQNKLKGIVSDFAAFYGLKTKIHITEEADIIRVNIETADGSSLIGADGFNLIALERLVKIIWQRQTGHRRRIKLDVNNYRQERQDYLQELARATADKVSSENRLVALRPMSAFERRLIHIALVDDPRVATESLGEDYERRVIVKPQNKK